MSQPFTNMYYLFKAFIVSVFSVGNLLLILFLSDLWLDIYGIIFASSILMITICSIFISDMDNYYLEVAIQNLQFLNKKIATTSTVKISKYKSYKRKYKPGSLEKMSETASNRKRDENWKFIK